MAEEKNRIIEIIELIQEKLFGSAYEDFRNNRKLKIEITELTREIIELIDSNHQLINDFAIDFNWEEFNQITDNFISVDSGINEEVIWKFCKHNLRSLLKQINK